MTRKRSGEPLMLPEVRATLRAGFRAYIAYAGGEVKSFDQCNGYLAHAALSLFGITLTWRRADRLRRRFVAESSDIGMVATNEGIKIRQSEADTEAAIKRHRKQIIGHARAIARYKQLDLRSVWRELEPLFMAGEENHAA